MAAVFCAYIRKYMKASVLKDLTYISETNLHQLWIQIQLKKSKSLLIFVLYRPPDCPLDCFENLLKPNYIQALVLCKPISVLGDLNCNMLKDNREQKALSDVSRELNRTLVINTPTRITNNCQSLIDVICTSSPSLVRNGGVLNIPISDHLPVLATLKLKPPKKPQYVILLYGVSSIMIPRHLPTTLLPTLTVSSPFFRLKA